MTELKRSKYRVPKGYISPAVFIRRNRALVDYHIDQSEGAKKYYRNNDRDREYILTMVPELKEWAKEYDVWFD